MYCARYSIKRKLKILEAKHLLQNMTSASGVVQLHEELGFPHSELPTNRNQFKKKHTVNSYKIYRNANQWMPLHLRSLKCNVKINELLFCWVSPEHFSHLVKPQSSTIFLLTGTRRRCPAGVKGIEENWLSREHCQLSQSLTVATYAYIFWFLTCNSYSCNPKRKRKVWALSCWSWNAIAIFGISNSLVAMLLFLFRRLP